MPASPARLPATTDLRLRPFDRSDLETLYQIDQACYPRGIAYSRRTLRWFLAFPGAECLVATVAGEIAGFILVVGQESFGHIVTLDVGEAFRRRGVGSALVAAAEANLASRGVRSVELETARENGIAVAFWTRHGYRTRGVLGGYYLGRHDALWMTKTLPPPTEPGCPSTRP